MYFLAYLYIVISAICYIALFLIGVESVINLLKRRAPSISCGYRKSNAVTEEIKKEFPNVKTVLDIGSGWGKIVKTVSHNFPGANITGVEIMPTPYIFSIIRTLFSPNIKIVFGNAFKYLENTGKSFDLGISYLLTPEMKDVEKFLPRFKMLLSVDFPLPNVKPDKKLKIYYDGKIQHWLYVYKK